MRIGSCFADSSGFNFHDHSEWIWVQHVQIEEGCASMGGLRTASVLNVVAISMAGLVDILHEVKGPQLRDWVSCGLFK